MRTTVDLTPKAYRRAGRVARERSLCLGEAISDLILRAGSPVFPAFRCRQPVTTEDGKAPEDD